MYRNAKSLSLRYCGCWFQAPLRFQPVWMLHLSKEGNIPSSSSLMDLELSGPYTHWNTIHLRSLMSTLEDSNPFLCVSQDFILGYMRRIGFSGLYRGICWAQVRPVIETSLHWHRYTSCKWFHRNVVNTDLIYLSVVVSCWRRDESASATYYFRQKSESEQAKCAAGPESLVKEWMYYRLLQQGENEFALRNKQVNCATPDLCTNLHNGCLFQLHTLLIFDLVPPAVGGLALAVFVTTGVSDCDLIHRWNTEQMNAFWLWRNSLSSTQEFLYRTFCRHSLTCPL